MQKGALAFLAFAYLALSSPPAVSDTSQLFTQNQKCSDQRTTQMKLQEINKTLERTFPSGLATHSTERINIVKSLYKTQAREALCEMVLLEAVSPYGWHGDTSKNQLPRVMSDFAKELDLNKELETLRKLSQERKSKLTGLLSREVEGVTGREFLNHYQC